MDTEVFKLRKALHAHTGDVRCLTPYLNGFVSGSRDTKAKIWLPSTDSSDQHSFHEVTAFLGPTHYVSCVTTAKTGNEIIIFVGSNDGNIYCYSEEAREPRSVLKSHQGTVCALATSFKGQLLSGSWDTTARLWQGNSASICLEGHTAAVWAVAFLTDTTPLTASADKTIKMWNQAGHCLKTFSGHEDVVRGLAVLNESTFLSTSNDTTIKQWTPASESPIKTFHGHENFVYCITILPPAIDGSFRFLTCSEDRTARIWLSDHVVQTIRLPATSLWSACSIDDGNIAIGASNGVIYIYTTNPHLEASEDEQKALEEEVAKMAIPAHDLGDIKIDQLPGPDVLLAPGTKEGQTKLVREGKIVTCHQWSASHGQWVKVGEVTGSADNATKDPSQKTMYEGKEYDYVFSVDIEDGVPPLKLPFNVTENPWEAAQRFIHKHELSQSYLDQIAQFIIKNSESVAAGVTKVESTPYDPFTGGNRYVPGTDPNTNANGSKVTPKNIPSVSEENPHFPLKKYVCFETVKLEPITKKILEFSSQVPPDVSVSSEDLTILLEMTRLDNDITLKQIRLLKMMLTWPKSFIFPVLDMIRIVLLHPKVNHELVFAKDANRLLDTLLVCASDQNSVANQLLSLKALCNLFANPSGESFAEQHMNTIFKVISSPAISNSNNVNIMTALATLYMNYATLLHRKKVDSLSKVDCLSNVTSLLLSRSGQAAIDGEVAYRLMVTIGILIHGDSELLQVTKAGNIAAELSNYSSSSVEKIKGCSQVLCKMLTV